MEEELKLVVANLKSYTKDTLVAELNISGIGFIELEIELNIAREVNSKRLNSIMNFTKINLESLKLKANVLLNSLAEVKDLSSFKQKLMIDFNLVGIWIYNDDSIHNQFKLLFNYNPEIVHMNEDILGYRTVNFSGSSPHYYISGVNWIY